MLPEHVTTRVTYSGTRLSSKFTKIKDKTVKENQRDIVYDVKYPEVSAEKTLLKKQHSGCRKEYLTIMVEMLNSIS